MVNKYTSINNIYVNKTYIFSYQIYNLYFITPIISTNFSILTLDVCFFINLGYKSRDNPYSFAILSKYLLIKSEKNNISPINIYIFYFKLLIIISTSSNVFNFVSEILGPL